MKVRRAALKDTVVVRTRTGSGSYGEVLNDPLTVPCAVAETRRLVRSGTGEETVSEATLVLHPRTRARTGAGATTDRDPMEMFTEDSEVMINGRESKVLSAKELRQRGCVVAVEVTCE